MRLRELAVALATLSWLIGACASNQTTTVSTPTPAPQTPAPVVYEVTANRLNVREAPNASGAVAGSVSRGELLTAPYDPIDGWVYVQSESGQAGYVSLDYLDRVPPTPSPAATSAPAAQAPAASATPAAGASYESQADPRLSNITEGMSSDQVIEILGPPTSQQNYVTGKAWIPYYYGSDTSRVDFKYAGVGRVVMSRNRWSGQLKVIRVEPDPSEDGY